MDSLGLVGDEGSVSAPAQAHIVHRSGSWATRWSESPVDQLFVGRQQKRSFKFVSGNEAEASEDSSLEGK